MAASGISKGDKVRVYMGEGDMRSLTGGLIWTVTYGPSCPGDTWILERDGQVIEINPGSHSFDGMELIERKETTDGRLQ